MVTEQELNKMPHVDLVRALAKAVILGGDIEIGAVEIKDGEDDTRADVDATLKALATFLRGMDGVTVVPIEANDTLKALKVDVATPLKGYESDPDAYVFVPGARAGYKSYEEVAFVTGLSPVTLDINTDLGRNAKNGYIANDVIGGVAGDFTVEFSSDGVAWGDPTTIKPDDTFPLIGLDVNKIGITWVANSAYRVHTR